MLTAITQKIECLASGVEVFYKLAEKYYINIVANETNLAGITQDDHVLCIGGGLCPFSAILFHQMTKARVTVIDNNKNCIPKSRKAVERFGLDGYINVFLQDGCSSDIQYSDYSVVHLALQVYPLEQVFTAVENGITSGTRLLVRRPRKRLNDVYGRFSNTMNYRSCVKHKSRNVGSTFLYVKEAEIMYEKMDINRGNISAVTACPVAAWH